MLGTSDGKQTPWYLFTPRYYHFNCCPVITPLNLELRAMTWSLTLYLKWSWDRIQKNNVNNSDCVHIISFWIYCYISQWHLMHFPFTWYFWRGVRSQLGMVCRNLFNDIFVLGFLLLSSNFQNFLPGFRVLVCLDVFFLLVWILGGSLLVNRP